MKEYVVFHHTKWDDIFDKNGNVVLPRENLYWFDGFWGIEDCKDWIADGNNKGDRCGAVTVVNTFVICKENCVDIETYQMSETEAIIVCVHTSKNLHRWQKVSSVKEATDFINNINNSNLYGTVERILYFKKSDAINAEEL